MDPDENQRLRLNAAEELLGSASAAPEGAALARLALTHRNEPTIEMRRLAQRLVECDDPSCELANLVLDYTRWRTMGGFAARPR